MLCPVRCFTCGRVLSDKCKYFDAKRAERLAKLKADRPGFHEDRDVAMGDVLDELGVDLPCCRVVLLTTVNLMSII